MKQMEGGPVASHIIAGLKKQVGTLTRPPGLAFIFIGNHSPSYSYVRMKKKRCGEVGIFLAYMNCQKQHRKNISSI